jgi:hypothetical protein
MFFHDYLTDTWFVQAIGADGVGLEVQANVPEPASLVAVVWIVAVAVFGSGRRRRSE